MREKPKNRRIHRDLEPGERVPMSFRVTPELKRRIDEAADESGRSIAQEIELRLELAEIARSTYLARNAEALQVIGRILRDFSVRAAYMPAAPDWPDDDDAIATVVLAIDLAFEEAFGRSFGLSELPRGARPRGDPDEDHAANLAKIAAAGISR